MKNKYYILRHGESEANAAGLITSDPTIYTKKYGLTHKGRSQVENSISLATANGQLDYNTLIFSSDIKRAAETAEIARSKLNAKDIVFSKKLRERSFGNYDGTKSGAYINIWPENEEESQKLSFNKVETAEQMQSRMVGFINLLEEKYQDQRILIVSHGDTLQVLQSYYAGLNPEQSRELSYIQQGELRELKV